MFGFTQYRFGKDLTQLPIVTLVNELLKVGLDARQKVLKSTDWVEVNDPSCKREEWEFGIEKIWWDQYYSDGNADAQYADMIFKLDMKRVHQAAESFFKMLFELKRSFVG